MNVNESTLQTKAGAARRRSGNVVRRGIAMVSATAIIGIGLVGVGAVAQAAELTPIISHQKVTVGYDPAGTGISVSPNTEITTGTQLTFHADWKIPGRADAGDVFQVPIPTSFRIASSEPFKLTSDGTTIVTCKYTAPDPAIVCTIGGGPQANVTGSLWFTGYLDRTSSGETPKWEVYGNVVVLPNPTVPPPGKYTPPFGTAKSVLSSTIKDGKAELQWGVYMWPGCEGEGIPAGTCNKKFVVSDVLGTTNASMPHTLRAGSFALERWERAQNPDGTWVSGSDVDTGVWGSQRTLARYVDGVWTITTDILQGEVIGEPAVAADGKSFTFTLDNAQVPYQYRLRYFSDADGAVSLDNEPYDNTATVNGEPHAAVAIPRVQGGGGASAEAYTSFAAVKKLTNDTTATLPTAYTLIATQGTQRETITVPADGTRVNSPYFPADGGPITVCEQVAEVPGVVWQKYTITGTGVTGPDAQGCSLLAPVGGQRLEITVSNHATAARVSVGDYTWIDTNRNGLQDAGEPPLPGVELALVGPDGKPVTDVTGKPVPPQKTDANGKYLFTALPTITSGSYTVKVVSVPKGYEPTKVEVGGDRAIDSSGAQASSVLPLATDGAADLTLDFGFVTPLQPPTTPVPPTTPGTLPTTGNTDAMGIAVLGAGLLLTGFATVVWMRRRARQS